MSAFGNVFESSRVLITGHTGFKGSWLSEWLLTLGAEVSGFALAPPTEPALFSQLGLVSRLQQHRLGDIRDLAALQRMLAESRPDFIFHLAAQPIVRRSYAEPVDTYATNVMGTVHLLEALRASSHPCTVVIATTDKCYQNNESNVAYVETDALGGNDPYSSSKACAELVVAAFRKSFFSPASNIALASARAGNVLGGGDWAHERIVPDCIRSLQSGQSIVLRHPAATRPWQHVLECLSGYMALASQLCAAKKNSNSEKLHSFGSAFNFGPSTEGERTVRELTDAILQHWPGKVEVCPPPELHESARLQLSSAKAEKLLGWRPVWTFEKTVMETVSWYQRFANSRASAASIAEFTREQISRYRADAQKLALEWAR